MVRLSCAEVKGFITCGYQVQLDFSSDQVDYFLFFPSRFQHIILSLEILVQTGCPKPQTGSYGIYIVESKTYERMAPLGMCSMKLACRFVIKTDFGILNFLNYDFV